MVTFIGHGVMSHDIHTTQQLASAAEAFVKALSTLFPGDTFAQFFHSGTLQRAYWSALEQALETYTTPETAPLAKGLMAGQVLTDPGVVDELLKLFLPGQVPDYMAVADYWSEVLDVPPGAHGMLLQEAQMLFHLLADELRQSSDLRQALRQLAQSRYEALGWDDAHSTAEQDLTRLLEAALMAGPSSLQLQVRHLLALALWREPVAKLSDKTLLPALANLAPYFSVDELRAVWQRIEALSDPVLRLRLLGRIAPHLSRLELTTDPLLVVRNASQGQIDAAVRVEVLLDLAPHLAPPSRDAALPPYQHRVLAGVQSIDDPASRVRALGALIPNLSSELQADAVGMAFESAACCIENEVARAAALGVLPSDLPAEFHSRLLGIAYELESPDARALLLGRMIPHVAPPLQSQALIGALNAIDQVNGDDARTAALIALAPYIDSMGPLKYLPEGLRQAIQVTFSIERADDRARAFAALAPYLSSELLGEALHVLSQIRDDADRATALKRLAPHLPDDLQVAAFAIAQEIRPAEARAEVLAAIAPYLSATARARALADALVAGLSIERRYERVVALADLAPQLPDDLKLRALQEALKATRSIPDESERGRALVFLAPHLVPEQMADALADAYTILDPLERVPALSALMPHLPDEPRRRVGLDAINLAHAVKPPHHKASILAAIAPVLPDDLLNRAVEVAELIHTPYDRMHVLTALLPRLPERLHDAALAAAHDVPNRYQRVNALLELIPHSPAGLRYPILDEALDTALGIQDDYDRASALAHLAPYTDAQTQVQNQQQDALSLALNACLEIHQTAARADLLSRLAAVWVRLLSPAQSYPLWRDVVTFLRLQPQADVMVDLAALSPVIEHMGVPVALGEVVDTLLGEIDE
jgi:hypothetical protein